MNAAFWGKVETMREIWELAKERQTTEEMINEKLLRTDREGCKAWHSASFRGDVDVMREIWKWTK